MLTGRKGRTTKKEEETREKNIKERSGQRAVNDTLKAVQAAVDAGGKSNKERARKTCGYCGQEGHTFTNRGVIQCPLKKEHDAKRRQR